MINRTRHRTEGTTSKATDKGRGTSMKMKSIGLVSVPIWQPKCEQGVICSGTLGGNKESSSVLYPFGTQPYYEYKA